MTKTNKKIARASTVLRGLPSWIYPLVVKKYSISNIGPNVRKMHHVLMRGVVENFLLTSTRVNLNCRFGFLDHVGHDRAGNLIAEPYCRNCLGCQSDGAAFAARMGLQFELSDLSFHAPANPECMRMTFRNLGRTKWYAKVTK